MDSDVKDSPRWNTSSFGGAPDPSAVETSVLAEQLDECNGSRGKLFGLHCAAETARGFVANHLMTTFLLVALAVVVASLLLSVWQATA